MTTRSAPPSEERSEPTTNLVRAIDRSVLEALGRPNDFLRLTTRQVTNTTFRVNVFTGPSASEARISHSFFVTTDQDGQVIGSIPAIVRRYE